jgi:hypothetical protein
VLAYDAKVDTADCQIVKAEPLSETLMSHAGVLEPALKTRLLNEKEPPAAALQDSINHCKQYT